MERTGKRNILIAVFAFFFIGGIAYISLTKTPESIDYEAPAPEEVVKQYFTAWGSKDYANMYAAISDGFKSIEPTASDLRAFKSYTESQGIKGINIISIKEASNDGITAAVDYEVEFLLSGGKNSQFDGTFTLKYRQGDVIPGWKLVHPYGENIDSS